MASDSFNSDDTLTENTGTIENDAVNGAAPATVVDEPATNQSAKLAAKARTRR